MLKMLFKFVKVFLLVADIFGEIADEPVVKSIVLIWTHVATNWHQLKLMCLMASQLFHRGLGQKTEPCLLKLK